MFAGDGTASRTVLPPTVAEKPPFTATANAGAPGPRMTFPSGSVAYTRKAPAHALAGNQNRRKHEERTVRNDAQVRRKTKELQSARDAGERNRRNVGLSADDGKGKRLILREHRAGRLIRTVERPIVRHDRTGVRAGSRAQATAYRSCLQAHRRSWAIRDRDPSPLRSPDCIRSIPPPARSSSIRNACSAIRSDSGALRASARESRSKFSSPPMERTRRRSAAYGPARRPNRRRGSR